MSVSVYTPAFDRLRENPVYIALQAECKAWEARPTVKSQDWTEQDTADYRRFTAQSGQLEWEAGHFGFRVPFDSEVPAIRDGGSCFTLTPADVLALVEEFRAYLRGMVLIHGPKALQMPDEAPVFLTVPQASVCRYKALVRVHRLGEGCYVA